jgi:hypothetical protein
VRVQQDCRQKKKPRGNNHLEIGHPETGDGLAQAHVGLKNLHRQWQRAGRAALKNVESDP